MPEKTTEDGRKYTIDGRMFTWTTEDGSEVKIPMRVKLKVIRQMTDRDMDAAAMFDILEQVAPGQGEVLDEMDIVTDFEPMFSTWQDEYNALTGASLGESPRSPV
jgi:hypothetical protein